MEVYWPSICWFAKPKHLFSPQRDPVFFTGLHLLSRLAGSCHVTAFTSVMKQPNDKKDLRTWNGDFASAGGITLALDAWPHIYKDQLDPYNSQSPLWKVTPLCSTPEKSERGISSYWRSFPCRSNWQRSRYWKNVVKTLFLKVHSLTLPSVDNYDNFSRIVGKENAISCKLFCNNMPESTTYISTVKLKLLLFVVVVFGARGSGGSLFKSNPKCR